MATPTVLVAEPVVTARQWSTGLSPRVGGWKFITQAWNNDEDVPTQWVLIDIEDGVVTLQDALNRIFSNTNYQVASANTLVTTTNQIRAANGRIFFPERANPLPDDDEVNVAYYDTSDEQIHQLPAIADPGGERQTIVFNMIFGVSGATLWGGTQSVIGSVPMIFDLDPTTLATNFICNVGTASGNPKYAYYLAKDEGPGADFLYVAVGQDVWELVSIDLSTNTPTTLLTTSGPGSQFIEFEDRAGLGWSVNVIDNGVQTRYWLADGAITPYPGSGAPPGGARNVTPYTNPLVTPPQIDWSRGIGHFLWRPNGSVGAWTEITYEVDYPGPITLESMIVLPNHHVVGNAQQYNGFYQYTPPSTTEWYGGWPLGVSQPALLANDDSTMFIAGYPSGALFIYDPALPWAPGDAVPNPDSLGSYGTDVRYPYFLVRVADNLFACGRRERDSLGSGIGVYDVAGATFGATTTTGLDDFIPRGFIALADRVVFSGEVIPASGAPEALLLSFDFDLNPIDSMVVVAGLQNTGLLFSSPGEPEIVVGLNNDSPALLYRFNAFTGTLLSSVNLGAVTVSCATQRDDGQIFAVIDQDLVRIDPTTLERTTVIDLELTPSIIEFDNADLYLTVDAELRILEGAGTISATCVFSAPNHMIYLVEAVGANEAEISINGSASPDVLTDSVGGTINRIARAVTNGYLRFGPGALTQQQAQLLWLSQGASPGIPTASARVVGRSGGPFTVDVDIDGDGSPTIVLASRASGSAYLILSVVGSRSV